MDNGDGRGEVQGIVPGFSNIFTRRWRKKEGAKHEGFRGLYLESEALLMDDGFGRDRKAQNKEAWGFQELVPGLWRKSFGWWFRERREVAEIEGFRAAEPELWSIFPDDRVGKGRKAQKGGHVALRIYT